MLRFTDGETLTFGLALEDAGLQGHQFLFDEFVDQILQHPVFFGEFEFHSVPSLVIEAIQSAMPAGTRASRMRRGCENATGSGRRPTLYPRP
jgi:hypothetical protein